MKLEIVMLACSKFKPKKDVVRVVKNDADADQNHFYICPADNLASA